MRHKKQHVRTNDEGSAPGSLSEAMQHVNGALLKLIKNYDTEFQAIAREAGTPAGSASQLAGVELDGFHFLLMKVRATALAPLTDRQRQIALSVAEGLTNKEIGSRLNITAATVAAHLRVIFKKLNVDSRSELLLRLFAAKDSS